MPQYPSDLGTCYIRIATLEKQAETLQAERDRLLSPYNLINKRLDGLERLIKPKRALHKVKAPKR